MSGSTARWIVGAVAASAMVAGCSSSGSSPPRPVLSGVPSTPAADAAQRYLSAVNTLCDALLPKVIAATHGGSIDVPAREWLATWPAHQRLLHGFDADVAALPVPPGAHREAAALAAYVRFANTVDAARLTAARKGQAAYAKEVKAESGVDYDPAIAALTAAGFNNSCTAR